MDLIKKSISLFKSLKELTLVIRSGNAKKMVDIQNGKHFAMVKTLINLIVCLMIS